MASEVQSFQSIMNQQGQKIKNQGLKLQQQQSLIKKLQTIINELDIRTANLSQNQHKMQQELKDKDQLIIVIQSQLTHKKHKLTNLEQRLRFLEQKIHHSNLTIDQVEPQNGTCKGILQSDDRSQLQQGLTDVNQSTHCKLSNIQPISVIPQIHQSSQNPLQQIQNNSQKPSSKFSTLHKSQKITLDFNESTAVNYNLYEINTYPVALTDQIVLKKGSSIRFKIVKIGWCVRVGLALKNVVAGNGYLLKNGNIQELGHGCYLLTWNGRSYSHSKGQHNHFKTDFKYDDGDVIKVETNETQLIFTNQIQNWEFRLELNLTQDQWEQACFCVNVDAVADQVAIE